MKKSDRTYIKWLKIYHNVEEPVQQDRPSWYNPPPHPPEIKWVDLGTFPLFADVTWREVQDEMLGIEIEILKSDPDYARTVRC